MFSEKYFTEDFFPHSYFAHAFSGTGFEATAEINHELVGNSMLKIEKLGVNWISGSDGTLEVELPKIYGFLIKAVVKPGDVLSPSLGYDIEIVGEDGVDVLAGLGHDMDSVNPITIYPSLNNWITPTLATGDHNLTIANAGAGRVGQIKLYFVESLGKKNVA